MENRRAWALITGASAGIGAEFARQLAEKGYDLILVARRRERLEALAEILRQRFKVQIEVLPADLADDGELRQVEKYAAGKDDLEVLVNNAGFGIPGLFAETEIDTTMTMVNVHVIASVRLTRAVLPAMIERNRGFVIQVSSISAFNSSTGSPTYGATKAYLNAFTDGLVTELYGTGVHVQALCPGFTHTEFHDSEKYEKFRVKERIPEFMWMDCDTVVRASLQNVLKRAGIYVPGVGNKILAFMGAVGIVRGVIHLYQALFHKSPISS